MHKIFLAFLGMTSLVAVCGFAIVAEISGLKSEIAGLKRDLSATKEKLSRVEKGVGEILAAQNHAPAASARADLRNRSARAAITLSEDEIKLVRTFIKVPPPTSGTPQTISIGDSVPPSALMLIPVPLMDKLPKLKDARFTVDRNGAIVIVGPASRVEVVLSPG